MVTHKTCTKCCVLKSADSFYKSKISKDGLGWRCRECQKEYRNNWISMNKERYNESRVKYYKNNAEKFAKWRKEYSQKNPGRFRERTKEHNSRQREILGDGYIKRIIKASVGIDVEKIPENLIEIVRVGIQIKRIKRFIKENK